MDSYGIAQDKVRNSHGIALTGAQLIAEWEGFVDSCDEGYGFDEYEYANDIDVRGLISYLMDSQDLAGYVEHQVFRVRVLAIDQRFRDLCHPVWRFPNERTWWKRMVPKRAGAEFARYCLETFGFDVDVVE